MDVQFYRDKWFEIHSNAARVIKGDLSHREFCHWMWKVPEQLPCQSCQRHCHDYLTAHPPEREWNVFEWAFKFHNAVNKRKGKALYSYPTALREYGL